MDHFTETVNGLQEIVDQKTTDGTVDGINQQLIANALKLIQDYDRVLQPMKPERFLNAFECGVCHTIVGIAGDDEFDNYCRFCGKAVDWT